MFHFKSYNREYFVENKNFYKIGFSLKNSGSKDVGKAGKSENLIFT
jgi:hypothetical protein